jgi:SAM-dependent methyltransferase
MAREQRLVFGEVAELYDRHRPSYPDQLIDDVLHVAGVDGREAVLEVGAGTGKATTMVAARGIPVVAIEPSEEMARIARRNCSRYAGVEIERSDFEDWDPGGRTFPLLFSAQAWHWVRPAVGYAKARAVLAPGGLLAAFWNRPAWPGSASRDVLLAAYERAVPELPPSGPMHPANSLPDGDEEWESQIAATDGLTGAEIRRYDRIELYSASAYTGLLATTSEVRLVPEGQRTALLAAVSAAIEANGDAITVPMATQLRLARKVS